MTTNNSCDYSPIQYDALVGAANGGITSVSPSSAGYVFTSNGVSANPSFQPRSLISVTAVTHAASPYTVLVTDYFLAVDCSSGVVTIKLPNAPTIGTSYIVKDSNGDSATYNITVTTVGGIVTIDGSTSYVINTGYQSNSFIFDGTNWEIF